MGGGASTWRRATKRIGFPCAFFSAQPPPPPPHHFSKAISSSVGSTAKEMAEGAKQISPAANKGLCAICLEPLSCSASDGGGGQRIFTAHCTHSFHFLCIASNVRHGSVTCPICRAYWSHLPRDLTAFSHRPLPCHQSDPILRILDNSIATFRVNRRSSLRSTRYDDDDPVDPGIPTPAHPRLHLALIPVPPSATGAIAASRYLPGRHHQRADPSVLVSQPTTSPSGHKRVSLLVKLLHPQATDLVLVVSPNGPHLRLLKQSMALVVFSLRAVDRLAIVTCSTSANRAFPLRRMSPEGKRTALHAIDRLFYLGGETDLTEGLQKGVKILEDRMHRNPVSCILHISDGPTQACTGGGHPQVPVPIHQFCVGYGFGASNGLVMHEFEDFLARVLGGVIKETQLRVGEEGDWVRLGELRIGEERRIPLDLTGGCAHVCIGYNYVEGGGGAEERVRTGEAAVGIGEKSEGSEGGCAGGCGGGARDLSIGDGRRSSVERWDYIDPFMARRWAKHLHGYKA